MWRLWLANHRNLEKDYSYVKQDKKCCLKKAYLLGDRVWPCKRHSRHESSKYCRYLHHLDRPLRYYYQKTCRLSEWNWHREPKRCWTPLLKEYQELYILENKQLIENLKLENQIIENCYLLVVTTPANTQHCPYLTEDLFFKYSSRIATDPVQAEGAVPSV